MPPRLKIGARTSRSLRVGTWHIIARRDMLQCLEQRCQRITTAKPSQAKPSQANPGTCDLLGSLGTFLLKVKSSNVQVQI
ncbi:hypothetical protein O3P69_013624 [Scylla paramamosain]|uniref:Uncharacterized protein n=1 Tax=Scylla paramamosain TaxID=85552 RepID=A0AAW0SQN7_SCYPA